MPLRGIGCFAVFFFSNDIMFTYSKMYSGKRYNYSIVILGLGTPAAALDIASSQILINFRGIFRVVCLTIVSLPFWFLWTASASLLGMHPRRGNDIPGPGLWVASVTAQAAVKPPLCCQHCHKALAWATGICLLSAVKEWHGVFRDWWTESTCSKGRWCPACSTSVFSRALCNIDEERLLLTAHTPAWVWYLRAQYLQGEAACAQKELAWELCCSLLLHVLSTGWCSR